MSLPITVKNLERLVKINWPLVTLMGIRHKVVSNKNLFLVRGKDKNNRTVRFVYGDDYPNPIKISTSLRKWLGNGKNIELLHGKARKIKRKASKESLLE